MNFPVIEMFHSIQGEGKYMGVPSFFVRVSGCNLRCVFKNSRCDTPYTSFNPEKTEYKSMDEVVESFMKMRLEHPKTTHIVITGGEPMLYQEGLYNFLERVLYCSSYEDSINKEYNVTIETNGTKDPSRFIRDSYMLRNNYDVDIMFSISPKLSSSVDKEGKFISKEAAERHDRERKGSQALAKYVDYTGIDFQLKFVYSDESSIAEIQDILSYLKITNECDYDEQNYVYLMPEGITVEHMNTMGKECVEQCLKYGWNFAPRLHILIWGDKRGV